MSGVAYESGTACCSTVLLQKEPQLLSRVRAEWLRVTYFTGWLDYDQHARRAFLTLLSLDFSTVKVVCCTVCGCYRMVSSNHRVDV
jgi:hypothetical protein